MCQGMYAVYTTDVERVSGRDLRVDPLCSNSVQGLLSSCCSLSLQMGTDTRKKSSFLQSRASQAGGEVASSSHGLAGQGFLFVYTREGE